MSRTKHAPSLHSQSSLARSETRTFMYLFIHQTSELHRTRGFRHRLSHDENRNPVKTHTCSRRPIGRCIREGYDAKLFHRSNAHYAVQNSATRISTSHEIWFAVSIS